MNNKKLIYFVVAALFVVNGMFFYRIVSSHPVSHKEQTSKIMAASATIELKNGNKVVKDQIPVTKGETALQQLKSYTSAHHIEIAITGSGNMAYVVSLENVKAGGKSGWMFSVNGKVPNVGAGATPVKPHDTVIWYYSKF